MNRIVTSESRCVPNRDSPNRDSPNRDSPNRDSLNRSGPNNRASEQPRTLDKELHRVQFH